MPFVYDEDRDATKSNCQAHLILIACHLGCMVLVGFLERIIASFFFLNATFSFCLWLHQGGESHVFFFMSAALLIFSEGDAFHILKNPTNHSDTLTRKSNH